MTDTKQTSFTPGPWRLSESWHPPIGCGPHRDLRDGKVFWGYSISGSNEHGGSILPTLAAVHNFPENIHANARLIAAAPAMFDALHGARDTIEQLYRMRGCEAEGTLEDWVGFIDAALALATGKEG